jgi:MEMO1 family protein
MINMKKIPSIFVVMLFFHHFLILHSQTVRPVKDNVGFCWSGPEMDSLLRFLSSVPADSGFATTNLIGGISVHDDYLYAGKVYFPLYKLIRTKEVVIFGVTHGSVKKEMGALSNILILDEFDKWRGPYKDVEISQLREIIKSKLPPGTFIVSNKAQTIEHSIEALIPFLQSFNREIKITPVMVTQMSFGKMDSLSTILSGIIVNYIRERNLIPGKDIFFLISNDADHYGQDFNNSPYGLDLSAHEEGTKNDLRIVGRYINRNIDEIDLTGLSKEIWPDSLGKKEIPLWCGRYPIVFGLLTTMKTAELLGFKGISGKLFKYSDSYTEKILPVKNTSMGITAPFSLKHWVGWFTAGIYLK